MHHREHPDAIRVEDVNDGVGERMPKVPPGMRRAINTKQRRVGLDLGDELADVI
jgi:hypothetical protein